MASYENAAGIDNVINDAEASGALSAATAAAISSLVNQINQSGGDAAVASAVQTVDTNITSADQVAADTQVIIQAPTASANVTFAPTSDVKAMVVGGGGDSNVTFQTSDDVTVQLGGGTGDQVATGAGDDTISFNGGSATINTGDGNDTVVLAGNGEAEVTSDGAGFNVFEIAQDFVGSATITAGDGFDRVAFTGGRSGHQFGYDRATGRFTMHSDAALSMDNVNIISFDTDGNADTVEQITVLADTSGEALVAKLYQVALGREAIDGSDGWLAPGLENTTVNHQLGGINWWFTEGGADTTTDMTTLGTRFLDCAEFHSKYDSMTDAAYVAALFSNLGGPTGVSADQYVAALAGGSMDRYQVAIDIAQSQEASLILGNDGDQYVITPA